MSYSTYLHELNNHRLPPLEELRIEDIDRPMLGDLISRGTIIRTSYSASAYGYIIDKVSAYQFCGMHYWSLTGFNAERDGTFLKNENNRIWLNDFVTEYEGNAPFFRKLFRNNDDEFEILGHGLVARKTGQFEMVL